MPHKESATENGWYDLVIVSGGLSHQGERLLAKQNNEMEKKAESIILLKPSIYGIGIDLNALWKRWKNRKK